MSARYPRVRVHSEEGVLLIREGLNFTFYMRRSHAEVAHAVLRSLESYLSVIGGMGALSLYSEEAGAWLRLDETQWELTRQQFLHPRRCHVELVDAGDGERRYRFYYEGKPLDTPSLANKPGVVSAVSFWLPTEYLEEHGPERVRALALELAAPLPFSSGHAGLSFNGDLSLRGMKQEVRGLCWRYPGLSVPDPTGLVLSIGTRVRTIAWLTFLGQPVLGEVGGVKGLRSRLLSPSTTVEPLEEERAVVTLGAWPEAGDTEKGFVLPAYRELARVLEPWLYFEKPSEEVDSRWEELNRWERRFLD